MRTRVSDFLSCEAGAVTADWVVLTAAILGVNILGIMAFLEGGLERAGSAMRSSILDAAGSP